MSLKGELVEFVRQEGPADFFGVRSQERFKEAPRFHRPEQILPGAESVLSFGLKIPEGVRKANHRAFQEEGLRHAIYIYQMHGYVELNRELNRIAYRVARFLEDEGYLSTPVPASPPIDNKDLFGAFSNRHAAVAAGQAEFGWNALAITEESGPRVRWVSVLTEADLSPDPLLDQGLCGKEDCRECVRVCPVDAIPAEEDVELKIDGRTYTYSKLRKERCRIGGVSGFSTKMARNELDLPPEPTEEDYLRALDKEDRWHEMERIASMCGRCIVECPVGG